MVADMYCKIRGIDSTGKSMPESMMIGMINTMADSRRATSWVRATFETNSPNESANRM